MTERPAWHDYFLGIAQAVSARGECTRSQVGAVIVKDRRIVATGYNGVPAGMKSCLDGICPRARNDVPHGTPYVGEGTCVATHAEANAVYDAVRRRLDIEGGTIYLTKRPCSRCQALLAAHRLSPVWPGQWEPTSL